MSRDPFYQQILDALDGEVNPDLFEQCAADLLRATYPTLVPVQGGKDSGMDGAIADEQGNQFPLVTTTGQDVKGNLRRNLEVYVKSGRRGRQVVLATSQALTTTRKSNLYTEARRLGFTLHPINDRPAIANLLYRNPDWCLSLLGLTGNPPALSVVPIQSRPLYVIPPIGRDEDLLWLESSLEDALLVGQPGSGKTFLLHMLTQSSGALFAVSRNITEIANAVRAQNPLVIMVDDAQLDIEFLRHLRHMREEIGAEFRILASCWPGEQQQIANAMNLAERQIRALERLPREQMLQIVNSVGIFGPNILIREILDQSEGRPGLAVTLAELCMRGATQEVALGDALQRDLVPFLESRIGTSASSILAILSLGDNYGLPGDVVVQALGRSPDEVATIIRQLEYSGVIWVNGDHYSLRPEALRYAIIRDSFFNARVPVLPQHSLRSLIDRINHRGDATVAIIGAMAVGARMDQHWLQTLVTQSIAANQERIWKNYTGLGRAQANWVLENHPQRIITVAFPALFHAPERAIPILLEQSVNDVRELHSNPDHPLRILEDWVEAGEPGTEEPLRRRVTVLDSVTTWLRRGGDRNTILGALRIALSPNFERTTTDVAAGKTVTFTFGFITQHDMEQLQARWPAVLDILHQLEITNWQYVMDTVRSWAHPLARGAEIPQPQIDFMQNFARCMLTDLVRIAGDHPGVLAQLRNAAQNLDLELDISINEEFQILYPERDLKKDWRTELQRQREAVVHLAEQWAGLQPSSVAQLIAELNQEAALGHAGWQHWPTEVLCPEIAGRVDTKLEWLRAFAQAGLDSAYIFPFLQQAVIQNEPGWAEIAFSCLEQAPLRGAPISLVLSMEDPPQDLLDAVLNRVEEFHGLVEHLCLRDQVPEPTLTRLLRHQTPSIAIAAAEGHWNSDPQHTVSDSVRTDWENVVIQYFSYDQDYELQTVFAELPSLAEAWLRARMADVDNRFYSYHDALRSAIGALSTESRSDLLRDIPSTNLYRYDDLVRGLVGNDSDVFRTLLATDHLRSLHLVPLHGSPTEIWVSKALVALEFEYSPEAIAYAAFGGLTSWSGNESDHYNGWLQAFERLLSHDDRRIREIGDVGVEYSRARREEALKKEKIEEIYGL